jgi:hypothetical protein
MMAHMSMGPKNRREFLKVGSAAIAAAAAGPKLWADAAQISGAKAANQDKIRGVMVDAARVPESMGYYRRVIEFCSDWEMNTL